MGLHLNVPSSHIVAFVDDVRIARALDRVDNDVAASFQLMGVLERYVQESKNRLSEVDGVFAKQKVIKGGKILGFIRAEKHVTRKTNLGVEVDLLDDAA